MELKVSLVFLQELTTGPCHDPDESSSHPHPTSLGSVLILFIHLCLCLTSDLFPSDIATIMYIFLMFPVSATCLTLLCWSIWLCLVRNTNYETFHYAVFPGSCYFLPFVSIYSPQYSLVKCPQFMFSCFSCRVGDQVSHSCITKFCVCVCVCVHIHTRTHYELMVFNYMLLLNRSSILKWKRILNTLMEHSTSHGKGWEFSTQETEHQ